jgi:hypothetical protein
LTALGAIFLRRSHGYCTACGDPGFAADGILGLRGRLTANASRMACLAGIHDPFRKAERLLGELSGWSCDAETIRRLCHQEARAARGQRGGRQRLPEAFAEAGGDQELHIDAGKVNTPDGWRDVKVAVFAKRRRAAPATSADYEQRDLPAPEVRSVLAAVAGALNYFCGHQERLGYAARLLRGQVIGSGLVEGTIKQRVNLRMKRSGARWLPEHVGPFVELMAMADTVEWGEYWAMAL